jgi:hypothetical protein
MPTYAIQLALTGQGSTVSFDAVTVVEAKIADQSVGVLIGRDVLASAAFMYAGQPGQCTLAF